MTLGDFSTALYPYLTISEGLVIPFPKDSWGSFKVDLTINTMHEQHLSYIVTKLRQFLNVF